MQNKILYTGGTFDLFHSGHVNFLKQCKSLADTVVVSLNTDDFILRYKKNAPVISYEQRKEMLLACVHVDEVVPNIGGADSKPAILSVKPDIIAIGDDWETRDYHQQMQFTPQWLELNNIELRYLPYTQDISSTDIKQRIITQYENSKGFKKTDPLAVINQQEVAIRSQPFRHVVINDFFKDHFYRELCDVFNQIKDKGLTEEIDQHHFYKQSSFDCYFYIPPPNGEPPFDLFYTQAWQNYFSDLFQRQLTPDVLLQLHHHKPHSESSYVHSDFAKVYFASTPLNQQINPWYHQYNYFAKESEAAPLNVLKRGRAIAIIYYLNNADWQQGDGGETALFHDSDRENPLVLVPPKSNSLLAFEITPQSFHRYCANLDNERNSIAMWFHATEEECQRLFPQTPLRTF